VKQCKCCPTNNDKTNGVVAVWSDFCAVAPSPELRSRLNDELDRLRATPGEVLADNLAISRSPRRLGFDDGVIIPPAEFPLGTPTSAIRGAAADRAPLRGAVRVVVVLVDFSDKPMTETVSHFNDLFFSTGVMPNGSVKEYYREVTNGLVDLVGEVVGPFRLPQTLNWYANNNFGIGRPNGVARANIMAQDAAIAANPTINFSPYDNDGNGYVDAFIVVHAGRSGDETGDPSDIWAHKWILPQVYNADGKNIYAYLTVAEDSKIGVCAHEIGHLIFGFPDLYDTDDTSEGIGDWCLMAGGSWNGGGNGTRPGDVPAHPSAWCKVNQGWVSVTNISTTSTPTIPDVKTSRNVYRVWKDGGGGNEYFLLENRQRTGFDAQLPGDGLLIWHIDESQSGNTDENHYKVGLMQADGNRDLEQKRNRGDAGDPYPGTSGNTSFTVNSNPNSKSYTGQDTCVSISNISPSAPTMTATVSVSCAKSVVKDAKDSKEFVKEKEIRKEGRKDIKEFKEVRKEGQKDIKEFKEGGKEFKEFKEIRKEGQKDIKEFKEGGKDFKDAGEKSLRETAEQAPSSSPTNSMETTIADLQMRMTFLEQLIGMGNSVEPFIGEDLRPDLIGGPMYGNGENLEGRMSAGDRDAKIEFDNMPPR
jgi:immune inhibitor A